MNKVTYTLNVGHGIPTGGEHESARVAKAIRRWLSRDVDSLERRKQLSVCEDGEEATSVVLVTLPETSERAFLAGIQHLASDLQQDCIAVLRHATDDCTEVGHLIGPRPYEGGFNPAFFVRF